MGRRALRRVDPNVNLDDYLVSLADHSQPPRPASLFASSQPMELEIGSGKGLFLESASQSVPAHNFLGIEISRKYARYAAYRLARQSRANARIVHGDAIRYCRDCIDDGAVAAAHVYFPDPWWKARHRKRRVMNPSFVRDLQRILEPGGGLHFWTDVEEYFQTTLALIADETTLGGPLEVAAAEASHDLDYRTHFERRMRHHGRTVYRAEFRNRGRIP